jgi:hypothetical protein
MMDLADMFDECFGVPKLKGGDLPNVTAGDRNLPPDDKEESDPDKPKQKKPTRRLRGKGGKLPPGSERKVRGRAVNIGNKAYILRLQPSAHKLEYAIPSGGNIMGINPNYIIRCGSKTAHNEHLLMRILLAAARDQIDTADSDSPEQAEFYAAEMRYKLSQIKKAKS